MISFTRDRKYFDNVNETNSVIRNVNIVVPQGSTFGVLQFDVNSNDNADHIPLDMRYKFVDDLSTLELLNLLLAGLASYNFRAHVASDVGVDQKILPPQNHLGQENLNKIEEWSIKNKTKLKPY